MTQSDDLAYLESPAKDQYVEWLKEALDWLNEKTDQPPGKG